MLYRPTPAEITAIIAQGIEKNPTLTSRYRKAEQILLADDLFARSGEWFCTSQSGVPGLPSQAYSVNGSCSCPDYQHAAAQVKGHVFCKHKLALEAYRRILNRHLEQRLIGNAKFRSDNGRSRLAPNTYLLHLWDSNHIGTHRDNGRVPQALFAFRWSPHGRTFATDADLAAFAGWLATANKLPTLDPMATDAELMDFHAWRSHWFAE